MRASLTSEAEDLNVQNTVSVINIAMHYMFLQLISVLNSIHYTKLKNKNNKKTKHSIFLQLLHILIDILCAFFCLFLLFLKKQT